MTTCTISGRGYTSRLVLDYLQNPPEAMQQTGLKIIIDQNCRNMFPIIEQIISVIDQKKPDIKITLDLADVYQMEPNCREVLRNFLKNLPRDYKNNIDIFYSDFEKQEQKKLQQTRSLPKTKEEIDWSQKFNAVSESTKLIPSLVNITMEYLGKPTLEEEMRKIHIEGFKRCIRDMEEGIRNLDDEDDQGNLKGFSYVLGLVNTLFKKSGISHKVQIAAANKCIKVLSGGIANFTEEEENALLNGRTTVGGYFHGVTPQAPEFTKVVLGARSHLAHHYI